MAPTPLVVVNPAGDSSENSAKNSLAENPAVAALAEAHHRIANSLTLLVGLVRLEASAAGRADQPFSPGSVRLLLEGIAARLNTIGHLHRILAKSPAEGAVELGAHLHEMGALLVQAFSSAQRPIRIEHEGEACFMLIRHVQPLVLIFCEIFINAVKYAHPAGVPLMMTISCRQLSGGRLAVDIHDDGVGLPEGFHPEKSDGLGFRFIRSLAAELGARLEFDNSALGLGFRFIVPGADCANTNLAGIETP